MAFTKSDLLQDPKATYVKVNRQDWGTTSIDIFSGLMAPLVVCPLVAVVDGSIIAASAGEGGTVRHHLKKNFVFLFAQPHKFLTNSLWLKNCFLCWMVYAGTYASVNLTKSYNERNHINTDTADINRFVVSFAANVGFTQIKDVAMVKLFAKGAVKVPMLSRFMFLIRDATTMVAAFCIADRVAEYFKKNYNMEAQRASLAANFIIPAALQTVTTVPHLYGMNFSKLRNHSQVWPKIAEQYAVSVFGRVCRIIPAISIGNNINIESRNALLKRQAAAEGQTGPAKASH